jgi:hypothetical protein
MVDGLRSFARPEATEHIAQTVVKIARGQGLDEGQAAVKEGMSA